MSSVAHDPYQPTLFPMDEPTPPVVVHQMTIDEADFLFSFEVSSDDDI